MTPGLLPCAHLTPPSPAPFPQGGALVHIYTDGTILISHGGTEMGQGLHQGVPGGARALGVPLSACHVAETASDKVPNAITTAGSMSTELYGMAVLDACRQLVHRCSRSAKARRGCKPRAARDHRVV